MQFQFVKIFEHVSNRHWTRVLNKIIPWIFLCNKLNYDTKELIKNKNKVHKSA